MDATNFLLKEYDHISNSLKASEDVGNTRLNYFLTLTTGLIGATGISKMFTGDQTIGTSNSTYVLLFVGLALLMGYGSITFNRIIHRNLGTD
jgi:hypothetical protein